MAAHEFLFALDLPDHAAFDEMLAEVTRSVLGHVGYACDAIPELVAWLHAALTQGGSHASSRCRVQFSAHAGQLQIVVSHGGGREWRAKRTLP